MGLGVGAAGVELEASAGKQLPHDNHGGRRKGGKDGAWDAV